MAAETVTELKMESNRETSCPEKMGALDCADRLTDCVDKLAALTNIDFEALEGRAASGIQIYLMELHDEVEKISEVFYTEWKDLRAQLEAAQEQGAAHV
jgi:hypothetical protein